MEWAASSGGNRRHWGVGSGEGEAQGDSRGRDRSPPPLRRVDGEEVGAAFLLEKQWGEQKKWRKWLVWVGGGAFPLQWKFSLPRCPGCLPRAPGEQTDSSGKAGSLWRLLGHRLSCPPALLWVPVAWLPGTPCLTSPLLERLGRLRLHHPSPFSDLSLLGLELHCLSGEALPKVRTSAPKTPWGSSSPKRQIRRLLFLFCLSVYTMKKTKITIHTHITSCQH